MKKLILTLLLTTITLAVGVLLCYCMGNNNEEEIEKVYVFTKDFASKPEYKEA